tara:strand:+ start:483 stop:3743 length:3261 start_codon:yes stop_codon:yes gene_type:complete
MVVFNNILAGASGAGVADYEISRSLRFNDSDTSYLSRTSSSASSGNTKLTYSVWVKGANIADKTPLLSASSSGGSESIEHRNDGTLVVFFDEWNNGAHYTTATFRDPSAWYHFVFAIDTTLATAADRVKIYVNGFRVETTIAGTLGQNHTFSGFNQQNKVQYIGRTANTSGGTHHYADALYADAHMIDGQALSPTDFGELDSQLVWQPREYDGTYGNNGFKLNFSDNSSNAALGTDSSGNNNTFSVHNLLAAAGGSTTLSISGYNNNLGSFPLSNVYDGNTSTRVLGTNGSGGQVSFSPALSGVTLVRVYQQNYVHYLNGSAVTPSASSGGWYTLHSGSAITLSSVGNSYDSSSGSSVDLYAIEINGVVVSSQSFSLGAAIDVDSLIDTPTDITADSGNNPGNYCTLNPLDREATSGTLSNGNLDITQTAAAWAMYRSTIFVSSGKYYWECTLGNNQYSTIGICTDVYQMTTAGAWVNGSAEMFGYYPYDGKKYNGSSNASYATADTSASGSVIGVALDMDNGTLAFYKDGVSLGTAYTGLTGKNVSPTHWLYNQSNADSYNFGQRPFSQTVPTGYSSLCTTNLPEPLIADGMTAMDVMTYSGDGTDGRAITGISHSPDLVWIKARNQTDGHNLFDIVRGTTKVIKSNNSNAELTESNSLTAFNSNGFTVGSNASNAQVNASGFNYVAWAWDAGSSNTSISAGSLNSSLYNQSAAWNSQVTGTSQSYDFGGGGLRGDNNWFDGNIKHASSALAGNTIEWSGSIAFTSSFAIASDNDGVANAVNITHGPSNTVTNVRSQLPDTTNSQIAAGTIPLTTLTGITSPVTKISCVVASGASGANGLTQVVADGKMLVDSGITLDNVPSIASTVRANPSTGFSIVKWDAGSSAGTVGHGLAAPHFIIMKTINATGAWLIYHKDVGASKYFDFTTAAPSTNSLVYTTAPTSSVFSPGNGIVNTSIYDEMIAYCFSPVKSYSSFNSYTGNGSADGPFVYTGFRPLFLLIKNTSYSGYNWVIFDIERNIFNLAENYLAPNTSNSEYTDLDIDILSNGFKIRTAGGSTLGNTVNYLSAVYITAAFAEHPFKTARAR